MYPARWISALALACTMAAAEPPADTTRWNNPDRPEFPGLVHGSFVSDAIGTEVGYNVYSPKAYAESDRRFPVVYFLHGSGGDENSDAAAFAGVVQDLIQKELIPPVLCVFPNGGRRSGYRNRPGSGEQVETMIIQELVPLIDRTYRTRAEREARVILGFSMGGAGAVRLALQYPELFSGAGSWGGAFAGRKNEQLAPEFAAEAMAPLAGRLRLILIVGTKDFVLPSHPLMVRSLIEAKVAHRFELLDGLQHDPGAYGRLSGEQMLRFLLVPDPLAAADSP